MTGMAIGKGDSRGSWLKWVKTEVKAKDAAKAQTLARAKSNGTGLECCLVKSDARSCWWSW